MVTLHTACRQQRGLVVYTKFIKNKQNIKKWFYSPGPIAEHLILTFLHCNRASIISVRAQVDGQMTAG